MSGGIYVCNRQNTEYRDVKTWKKLKMKIRKFYGTGLDFLIFQANFIIINVGVESWFLAWMSLNGVFLRLNKKNWPRWKYMQNRGVRRDILRFKFYVTFRN